jgi:sulfur carrier protein
MSADLLGIHVNGNPRQVPPGTTVAALIVELGLGGKPVAVERNREVVPRARHATTELADGDRVELVTFVGGG